MDAPGEVLHRGWAAHSLSPTVLCPLRREHPIYRRLPVVTTASAAFRASVRVNLSPVCGDGSWLVLSAFCQLPRRGGLRASGLMEPSVLSRNDPAAHTHRFAQQSSRQAWTFFFFFIVTRSVRTCAEKNIFKKLVPVIVVGVQRG